MGDRLMDGLLIIHVMDTHMNGQIGDEVGR